MGRRKPKSAKQSPQSGVAHLDDSSEAPVRASKPNYEELLVQARSSDKSLAASFQSDPYDDILSFEEVLAEVKFEIAQYLEAKTAQTALDPAPDTEIPKKAKPKKKPDIDDDDAFLDSMIEVAKEEQQTCVLDTIRSINAATVKKVQSAAFIGDIRKVIELMSTMPEKEEVQFEALQVLKKAIAASTVDILWEENVAIFALRSISMYPSNLVLTTNAFATLFAATAVGRKAKTGNGERMVYMGSVSFQQRSAGGSKSATTLQACDACDPGRSAKIASMGGIDVALQVVRRQTADAVERCEQWGNCEFMQVQALVSFLLRLTSVDALKLAVIRKNGVKLLNDLFDALPEWDDLPESAQEDMKMDQVVHTYKLLNALLQDLHEWFFGHGTWRADFKVEEYDPSLGMGASTTKRFERGTPLSSVPFSFEASRDSVRQIARCLEKE